MSITRVVLLGSLGLAACGTPTGPNASLTTVQATDQPQVGHFHPIGTTCVPGGIYSQRCAVTAGAQ
jgi:hypothetical protein